MYVKKILNVENLKNLQKEVKSLLMQLVKYIYQAYVETDNVSIVMQILSFNLHKNELLK